MSWLPYTADMPTGYFKDNIYMTYTEYYGDGTVYGLRHIHFPDGTPGYGLGPGMTRADLVAKGMIVPEEQAPAVPIDISVVPADGLCQEGLDTSLFPSINWRGVCCCETSYYYKDGVKSGDKYYVVYPAKEVPWNVFPPQEPYWLEVPEKFCPNPEKFAPVAEAPVEAAPEAVPEAAPEVPSLPTVCSEACICVADAEKPLKKVIVKVNGVTVSVNTNTSKEVTVNVDNAAATVEFIL